MRAVGQLAHRLGACAQWNRQLPTLGSNLNGHLSRRRIGCVVPVEEPATRELMEGDTDMQTTVYEAPAAVEAGTFTDLTRRRILADWLDNETGSEAWRSTQEDEL